MREALADQLALLPRLLAAHVTLTLVALGAAVLISLPLAALALRVRVVQGPALAVASVVQTIPGLALLALMVPLLGRIGWLPAVLALTLYSVLPILRNTVTGVRSVDPAIVEAARGVGMFPGQVLLRVELPLASPVIIAGLRTATVWVVGIATLATPVGAASLGDYIFSGLQTQNSVAVLTGCVAAALLALVLDGLIRLYELSARRRSRRLFVGALALTLLGLAGVYGPVLLEARPGDERREVIVGAKTFTEQYILAHLLAERLEAAGFATRRLESLGSTVVFDALVAGEIDCYVDYTGTIWANHMRRSDFADAETTRREVCGWLERERGVACLGPLGFENAYAFAMRRGDAERLGVRTVDDLSAFAPGLRMAADYELFSRPEWEAARRAYGLRFRERRSLDPTLMYGAVRDGQVDVIGAFSTDGRIDAYDLVTLDDPRQALPPYDAILLCSARAAQDAELRAALRPLVGALDDDLMRWANRQVDVDGRPVREAAAALARRLDDAERVGSAQ